VPTVYLIRHAQASILEEDYDNLSELGIKQANLLAQYFQDESIIPSIIITGSLKRHIQTAEPTIKLIGKKSKIKEYREMNEFSKDLMKGLIEIELNRNPEFAKEVNAYQAIRKIGGKKLVISFFKLTNHLILKWKNGMTPPNIESYDDFVKRILFFKEELMKEKTNTNIFIFSSGTPISYLTSNIIGMPEDRRIDLANYLWNTSVSVFKLKNSIFFPISINTIPHLHTKELRSMI
jgi:broad specificity phosphatase PhoE